jgi:hypothetical protein
MTASAWVEHYVRSGLFRFLPRLILFLYTVGELMIVHGRAGRSVTVGYASLVYKFLVSYLGWHFRPPNT